MAMFSMLVSTNPTAATVCKNGEAGGGEGGTVTSCLGCERTTEPMPNTSAANAISGKMNFFISLVSFHALTSFSTCSRLWKYRWEIVKNPRNTNGSKPRKIPSPLEICATQAETRVNANPK